MRIEVANPRVGFYIGDVRDPSSLDRAMVGVDYIFHAAALKQLPSCDFPHLQAVQTDILCTENVLESAFSLGVRNQKASLCWSCSF